MPPFRQKPILRIPVTKSASNFVNNYTEARLSGRAVPATVHEPRHNLVTGQLTPD